MKNKSMWIGGLIGGVYAFIPFLGVLLGDGSGDPGPYWVFILPPFWPAYFTFQATASIFSLLGLIKWGGFEVTANTLNIIWWILIGGGIGYLLKRREEKMNGEVRAYKKLGNFSLLGGIIILALGYLVRIFLPRTTLTGFVFMISLNLFILLFIFFIINKIIEKINKK